MLKTITLFTAIITSTMANPVSATLLGVNVTVQNTIQSPSFTGGSEDLFGSPQSRIISDAVTELPSFVDAYDIDIADSSIAFRWVDTPFSQIIGGPISANVHDRNYFVFDLPENVIISNISFDPLASELLPGSAEPTAEILSSNQLRTVFSEGVIREIGFNPVFNVETSPVPVPATVWLLGSALIGLFGMRKNKLSASFM